MSWRRIAGFRLVTREPERLLAFYAAFGFRIGAGEPVPAGDMASIGLSGGGTRWPLRLGAAWIDLDRYDAEGRPYPAEADAASLLFQHFALVTDDVAEAWSRARAAGARTITAGGEPVTLPKRAGGVTAIKFSDPEGHPLELIRFPDSAAKGWTGTGVLGIDHSAIAVADAAASRAFYEKFGLAEKGATFNHGPEQARLDGLSEPEVDVLPLHPPAHSPHLELLGYRSQAGRPAGPVGVADVAATRIVWEADAPGLVRDPDGHRHELLAR